MILKKYKVETYSFSEFKNRELEVANSILESLKENKVLYAKVVLAFALIMHLNCNVYAQSSATLGIDIENTFGKIIGLLEEFARWACLGFGIKSFSEEMLSGANFKQATLAGLQYWLSYVFIQLYPKFFDMIRI